MTNRGIISIIAFFIISLVFVASCNITSEKGMEDSLEAVPILELIEGTENATIRVNKGESTNSFFTIDIGNIKPNSIISNGKAEGWCIQWDKPIDSEGGFYENVPFYSTFGDKQFKPINYFLNERRSLREKYPEMTYREEQAIIWSLRDFPEFNIDTVNLSELPSRLVINGQPRFSVEIVKEVIQFIRAGIDDFEYEEGQMFAVVNANSPDNQTTMTVVGETMYAYGDGYIGSFRCNKDDFGIKWGWVFEHRLDDGEKCYPFLAGVGASKENCSKDNYSVDINQTKVGNLYVTYSAPILSLKFKASDDNAFREPHIWIGSNRNDIISVPYTAPGQYPYPIDFDDDLVFAEQTFNIDITEYLGCDDDGCSATSIFLSVHAGN